MTEQMHPGDASVLQRLNDSIRENPLGAALVGMGIVWMLAGTSGMAAAARVPGDAARRVPRMVRQAAETAGDAAAAVGRVPGSVLSAVGAAAGSAATAAGEAARATLHAVSDTAEKTAAAVGQGASRIGKSVGEITRQAGGAVHQVEEAAQDIGDSTAGGLGGAYRQLATQLQANPLLLGGIGLVIGAGLATLFPRTGLETRLMGETAEDVRARAGEMANLAATKVEQTAHELGVDAREIAGTARHLAEDLAQKAKSVAEAGREALAKRAG